MRALLLLAAVIPCIFLVARIRRRMAARGEAEGLWSTFGLGALTTGGVLAIAPFLASPWAWASAPWHAALEAALFRAAIPETVAKFAVVLGFAMSRGRVRDAATGVAHGIAASLGFACVEAVLFASHQDPAAVALRSVTTVPCHAMLGALLGWYAGRGAADPLRAGGLLTAALLVPLTVHAAYDFPLVLMAKLASTGAAPPGVLVALAATSMAVLVAGCVRALRIVRAELPEAGTRRRSLAFAASSASPRILAVLLVWGGAVVATTGASIVGSLVFVGAPGVEAIPNGRAAMTALGATGAALLCFGLAFAIRGLHLRSKRTP